MTSGRHLRMGAGYQWRQPSDSRIENLQSQRESQENGQWFSHSRLHKTQKDRVRRASGLVNTQRFAEAEHLERTRVSHTPSHTMRVQLFHPASPELCHFIINQSSSEWMGFQSFLSCSSKWFKPKEAIVGTSDLEPVGQEYTEQP